MAVASGSRGSRRRVVLTEAGTLAAADLAAVADLGGAGVVVRRGDPRGVLHEVTVTR